MIFSKVDTSGGSRTVLRIQLLNITVLLFLFRSSIPIFKYPFLLFYFFFILDLFLNKENSLVIIKYTWKNYFIILLLVFIYLISFFKSDKIFLLAFKELINIIILLSFILFFIRIITKEKLGFFISNLINLIIWFSVIISINGLYEYFKVFFNEEVILQTDATLIDYNFAILPAFFGIVSILFKLPEINRKREVVLYNFLLLIESLQILLSSSRRGFILYNIILFFMVLNLVLKRFHENKFLITAAAKYKYYLIMTLLMFFGAYLFIFGTTYSFKQMTFSLIGIKRINTFQGDITKKCYRYFDILNQKTSYPLFYKKIWSPGFSPKDPDSGWSTTTHKTVFPLVGNNVKIVPNDAKGYLLDKTSDPYLINSDLYSFNELFPYNSKVNESDTVRFSAYCFVSEDFNGDWALIALTNNTSVWKGTTSYDFNNKGTWQKLNLSIICTKGEITPYFVFCKNGVTDFSSLEGYVIFAYPECEIISSKTSANEDVVYLKKGNTFAKKLYMPLNHSGIYRGGFLLSIFQELEIERDPVRKFVIKLISEDTTYFGYSATITIDTIKNTFSDMRLVRWQFTGQIFSKEYNLFQKFFGGGFNFLNWYGYYFLKDKTASDWPHNPFLSILLYSGIIGLLIYCFFLYKVFYYYLKYRKEYPLLFVFFLITFFFSFFSGGSPFDPPIMGFFSILPFFIHYVHQKESSAIQKSNQPCS